MTNDLLEKNKNLRKQVEELKTKIENNDFDFVDLDAVIAWKEIVFPMW